MQSDGLRLPLKAPWPKRGMRRRSSSLMTDQRTVALRSSDNSKMRIRWETGPNRGGGATRNRLLELARGSGFNTLMQMIICFPTKLRSKWSSSLRDRRWMWCLARQLGSIRPERGTTTRTPANFGAARPLGPLGELGTSQTGAPLWRRQAICEVGGWKPDQPCCQEHELYI